MQILNWPHTLQQTIAVLWLKAISSASLQNWLCCNRAALNFRHSWPYTVLNVSFNKVPKQFLVHTERVFSKEASYAKSCKIVYILAGTDHPAFMTALEGCHDTPQPPEQKLQTHLQYKQRGSCCVHAWPGCRTTAWKQGCLSAPPCVMGACPVMWQDLQSRQNICKLPQRQMCMGTKQQHS